MDRKVRPLQANKKIRMRLESMKALKPFNLDELGVKSTNPTGLKGYMDFSIMKKGQFWNLEKLMENMEEYIFATNF